ncbi:MAG: NADH-quinone oxidoreductase subunit NuoE [Saprospiraceae bacterium]|nr:NADH-quinone oxidoreductase subunit NuoE [Saprospiraceae bacterium]
METQEKDINEVLCKYEGKPDNLIPLLQQVQSEYGYLPEETLLKVAEYAQVPSSQVYGVATFYTQFRFTPIGRNKIMVCRGTACHVKGAPRITEEIEKQLDIKEGETTEDMEYTLESVACIGACGLAPCMMVNDKVEAKLSPKKITEYFKERNKK